MKRFMSVLILVAFLLSLQAYGEGMDVYQLVTANGTTLTEICYVPEVGDEYIAADNQRYEVIEVASNTAIVSARGVTELPSLEWMDPDAAMPVASISKRIALYCTHSDESYEPSDGFYSTNQRGTIYQVANSLADELARNGIETSVADTLHHPHDAGAYRRSRQTAVELMKTSMPDCLIDIHRDGIPNPASYAVSIGGERVSKIRLLVGRGNQNAGVNKDFALMIKAVADQVYPGLIKDIYMGKGTFNQDLLPHSILFECGTYTLEKERVLASMSMMADVLNRALYGGIVGSAGRVSSDVKSGPDATAGITMGEPDAVSEDTEGGIGSGFWFLGVLLFVGLVGFAILSTGSVKNGAHKAGRNLNEMTGGLIGKKPDQDENHEHS